jgi:hypothetical protein
VNCCWPRCVKELVRIHLAGLGTVTLVTLLLMPQGCTQQNASPGAGARPSLQELGLTAAIPDQVRMACAEARRLATVRVICPRLIPDVRITEMQGSFGSIVFDAEPRVYMLSFDKDFFGSTPPPEGVKHLDRGWRPRF